jgi:hypothetical protein
MDDNSLTTASPAEADVAPNSPSQHSSMIESPPECVPSPDPHEATTEQVKADNPLVTTSPADAVPNSPPPSVPYENVPEDAPSPHSLVEQGTASPADADVAPNSSSHHSSMIDESPSECVPSPDLHEATTEQDKVDPLVTTSPAGAGVALN